MGRWDPFLNYSQEVDLWGRAAKLEAAKRASDLILNMDPVAREVCVAAGREQSMDPESAAKMTQALNDYFAPDDVDLIYREMARFLQFKRTTQSMDEYVVRSDPLRRKHFLKRLSQFPARKPPRSPGQCARKFGNWGSCASNEAPFRALRRRSSTRCCRGDGNKAEIR